jgi:hypothetical protein
LKFILKNLFLNIYHLGDLSFESRSKKTYGKRNEEDYLKKKQKRVISYKKYNKQ